MKANGADNQRFKGEDMADTNVIEEIKKEQEELNRKQKALDEKKQKAKTGAIEQIKSLAEAFDITFADVKGIFPAPRKNTNGRKPKAKYRAKEGAEWPGTGANPPKEFIDAIRANTLHDLLIDKTEENVKAAKKYADNWNAKHPK